MSPKRIVVGITGASGAIYAMRLLRACLEAGHSIDLVVSDYGKRLLIEECELNLETTEIGEWLDRAYGVADRPGTLRIHSEHDLGATIASGTQQWTGMVVVPCSMKTLAGIAQGSSSNLIERAADVTLKECRKLVLVPRETPLSLIQLENMTRAARAGAVMLPAMPAFYDKPETFDDQADFIVARILSVLGIPLELRRPWQG